MPLSPRVAAIVKQSVCRRHRAVQFGGPLSQNHRDSDNTQIAASCRLRRPRLRCNRGCPADVFPFDLRKLRWHFLATTCYDVNMIQSNSPIPELTDEQQQALEQGNGVVQGESYLLVRHDVVLDWFGYTPDQLHVELQPAIEQADRGELEEWNLQEFLKEVRRPGDAKSE
jgi:hypothetical protein